jgi:TolB-like protein/DNA-binding winged helix-turn-helix (wHTH) protein/Tfp pilus assembly protein PilF
MSDEQRRLFGDYTLDKARGALLCAGQPVHLRPQAFKALTYLVEHNGYLISKDRLIEEVWQGRAVTDDSLVQCLRDVRLALGEEGGLHLRNERGRGYIFELEPGAGDGSRERSERVEILHMVLEEETDDEPYAVDRRARAFTALDAAGNAGHARPGVRSIEDARSRQKRAAAATVILVALALVGGGVYLGRSSGEERAVRSVAVLPFANGSGAPALDYLSEGLSERLIDRLSEIPGVKVIARTSAFKFKSEGVDVRAAAGALGVEALVTGRVVLRGEDLQIRAELVDARTGAQMWGDEYLRRAIDIQAVQEEIASTVAAKLRARMSAPEELPEIASRSSRAYQLYLNGLFYRRKSGMENVRRALAYFDEAVAIDPGFALAWVGVADAHLYFAGNSYRDPGEALSSAKAAAERAAELDERLPELHVVLATIKLTEWDWAGAERAYKRAIDLSPNLAAAHRRYGLFLSPMSRHAESLAEIARAQELDPLASRLEFAKASSLLAARRYDEATEILQTAVRLEPELAIGHYNLANAYSATGRYSEAVEEYRAAIAVGGESTMIDCYLGATLARAGRRTEALSILATLERTSEYVSPAELATLYLGLGQRERAIATLERAYAERDLHMQFLEVDFFLDDLRGDPRFRDLVHRVGLPE